MSVSQLRTHLRSLAQSARFNRAIFKLHIGHSKKEPLGPRVNAASAIAVGWQKYVAANRKKASLLEG
jgi:hypothetical protein